MSDHLVVRAGLTMFICPEPDLDLVGEAGADVSALPQLRTCAPDVVILDVEGGSAGDLLAAMSKAVPSTHILVLAAARNSGQYLSLLRKGAIGLVLKESPVQVILKALRRREHDGPSVPALPSAVYTVVSAGKTDIHARRIAGLTARERAIVSLIGEGLRNDQVAVRLGVAEKTVRNQLSSLFDKLGVNDRLGLAVYAFEHGSVVTAGTDVPPFGTSVLIPPPRAGIRIP